MYYISVANQSRPSYVENHDLKINFNDLGTVAAIVIALLSMFSKNTKSQAKELDHETFEKTSRKMESLEQKLEKMVERLSTGIEKLTTLTAQLDKEISLIKAKQETFSSISNQIEGLRKKQEELDIRIGILEHKS
jgi:predicted RNase H-like nuclease (RuvC/YqgF family)